MPTLQAAFCQNGSIDYFLLFCGRQKYFETENNGSVLHVSKCTKNHPQLSVEFQKIFLGVTPQTMFQGQGKWTGRKRGRGRREDREKREGEKLNLPTSFSLEFALA